MPRRQCQFQVREESIKASVSRLLANLKISVHCRGIENRFAWGCRRGIFTPSLDLRKQGEPGGTLHVGHASLIAGHIFRSYLANSWVWIFQPSSLRIGMDSSREHPKPDLLWVALLQGQPFLVPVRGSPQPGRTYLATSANTNVCHPLSRHLSASVFWELVQQSTPPRQAIALDCGTRDISGGDAR
jgi:hypothetical protein